MIYLELYFLYAVFDLKSWVVLGESEEHGSGVVVFKLLFEILRAYFSYFGFFVDSVDAIEFVQSESLFLLDIVDDTINTKSLCMHDNRTCGTLQLICDDGAALQYFICILLIILIVLFGK